MQLPPGYEHLGAVEQLVTVTNLERAARGLPVWEGPATALGGVAEQGVISGSDPAGPAGTTWASNMASGVLTPLEADFEWMYDDGPGGTNVGCTSSGGTGCWAHRDNLLSSWAGSVGAAVGPVTGSPLLVVVEVMVAS